MIRRAIAAGVLSGALVGSAGMLGAQTLGGLGVRAAPQFQSFDIQSPSNTRISEFSVPLFALMPVTQSLTIDVGTAWARSRVVQSTAGTSETSDISGLTDTQVRANYTFGSDFAVLTGGLNLPTGQSTVRVNQQLAANLIGSDFLSFPISNMGTGFGATAGVAVARPLGEWNVGAGVSLRRSSQYDPFDAAGAPALHYQPGNEYRARVGVDRGVGVGRLSLGFTYSKFGDDDLGGSIYNTGDRYLTTVGFDDAVGTGTLNVSGWNLYRAAGSIADGTFIGHENITNANVSYGIAVGAARVEPELEQRVWTQSNGLPSSLMTTVGVRVQARWLGFAVLPSVGFSLGRVGAQDINGAATTATLTGFHGMLAIRLR